MTGLNFYDRLDLALLLIASNALDAGANPSHFCNTFEKTDFPLHVGR
jgi:hypothetical protein